MEEKALVTGIKDDKIKVKIIRVSQWGDNCADCGGGCKENSLELELRNEVGAKLGDIVLIETATKSFMKQAYLVYGIPLSALIVGIFIGFYGKISILKDNEINAVFIGVSMMLLSGLVLKLLDNNFRLEDKLRVKRIIKNK